MTADSRKARHELGLRLRDAREYIGFSQEQVAKALGLRRPAISDVESGNRKVEATELSSLAKLYSCSVDALLNGEDEAFSPNSIEYLARTTQGLSEQDMTELVKFASYLKSK